MREILFRAKAINRIKGREYRTSYKNGDWVYGLVTEMYDDRFPNLPATMRNTDGVSNIDVDYKSIGQYTGLTDKNGKKIFEGDIIKQINSYDKLEMTGFVRFSKSSQFIISHTYTEKENCYKRGKKKAFAIKTNCEIIGNIYDNPELLEVENAGHTL